MGVVSRMFSPYSVRYRDMQTVGWSGEGPGPTRSAISKSDVAKKFATWAAALEHQAMARLKLRPEEAKSYRGRAQEPRIIKKPMLDRPRLVADSLGIRGGQGIVERLLQTLIAMARRVGRLLRAETHTELQ